MSRTQTLEQPRGASRVAFRLRRALGLAMVVLTAALTLGRLVVYLTIQYPAPSGDGILFASVAQYHCAHGHFATPIFPLDPSGRDRYVWHAIGHPALLSLLNIDCSNAGSFAALSLILLTTFALGGLVVARARGPFVGLLFAVTVFALQTKQDFRPETTAMLLVVVAQGLRIAGRRSSWLLAGSLLAWVHPTALILYGAYAVLSTDPSEWKAVAASWKTWLPLLALLQGACVFFYPFALADLLQGLTTQGANFARRTDGDVFTYFVRSDFFPLFGAAFLAVYALALRSNWKLLCLLPLVWFYGVRVPPAYYNLMPLFIALLMTLLLQPAQARPCDTAAAQWPSGGRAALAATSALALLGLLQGNLRDLGSHLRYRATLEAAVARYDSLVAQDVQPCRVPAYFTMIKPPAYFEDSYVATARGCSGASEGRRWDFFMAANAPPQTGASDHCLRWPEDHSTAVGPLARLFRSDSGYSFAACRHQSLK